VTTTESAPEPTTEQPTEPIRRPHPGVVVTAVLFVVVVIGSGALQLLSQAATGRYERTSTLVPSSERFTVAGDSGSVRLSPSSDGDVHVRTSVSYGLGEPELIEEATPAGVRLDATCSGVLATHCEVDYVVEVPPSFAVFVEGSSGDVTVSSLTGPVTVDRSTGDIALFDLAGPLDVTTRTGVISGNGLRSDVVRAETRSGDIQLGLVEPPHTLAVDTGTGEVDVAVPATGYRVDARSGTGEATVLVPTDPVAPGTIVVGSGSGDVRVRPSL
jgi:Putative adhesin